MGGEMGSPHVISFEMEARLHVACMRWREQSENRRIGFGVCRNCKEIETDENAFTFMACHFLLTILLDCSIHYECEAMKGLARY